MKPILLALCVMASAPCAAQFSVTGLQGSVAIEGHLQAVDTLTGERQVADASDARTTPPLRVGLALALPDGLADVQGRAAIETAFDARTLSFTALADVDASGHGDGMLSLSGFGHAAADLTLHFTLAEPGTVVLGLTSSVTRERDADFAFLLARADGTALWRNTTVIDAGGNPSREVTRALVLDAGGYDLVVSLDAASAFDDAQSTAGRTTAAVSLSLVPEPAPAWLLAAGLAALGLRRRR